jgi:RHS repeat-associated protein
MKQHLKYFCAAALLLLCGRSSAQKVVSVYNGESEISAPVSVILSTGFNVPAGGNVRIFTTGQSYLNCQPLSSTPSTNQNFILSRIFKKAGVTEVTLGNSRNVCEENQSIQYFDGLGRPLQTVQVQGSPGFKDIVQPIAYDAFGREVKKYQPYAAQTGTTGSFRTAAIGDQAGFYNAPTTGIKATPYPFAETVFEASPLNRVQQQGAPGESWQISGGHTVKMEYGTNVQDEVKLWTINATDNGATATVYGAGKLYKTTTKDENWKAADLKAGTTDEFKDFEGRVVLKRVWESNTKALFTYYVYDDLGNLRYVLPPAVNPNGQSPVSSFNETQPIFDSFIYGYRYDGRKRLVEKKIPGKGWEFMVYNKLDQVVLSQDANQRNKSPQEWLYSKYDALGRPVASGIYPQTGTTADNGTVPLRTSKNALQATLDNQAQLIANGDVSVSLWETRTGADYDGKSYPQTGGNVLTVNYYDNYDFTGNSFGQPTATQAPKERTKSLLTGTKVKNLGAGTMLLTVNYYDLEGRVVQSKSQHQLNGTDVIDNTYSFVGELIASTRTHTSGSTTTTITNRYEYDHMGRKIATFENINKQGEVALNHLEYNEIGQLSKKNLQNDTQVTTFAYNERGWMKNSTSNQFSMKLDYEDGASQGYNGNITKQYWDWSNTINPTANIFNYGYDKLNRLGTAATVAGVSMSEALTYDVMGNIASLNRDGAGIKTYNYYNSGSSNRLQSVTGLTTQNYEYDANGNATKDGLSGITLTYNYLNLPATAIRTTGTPVSITYTYDATGNKLAKSSNGSVRNYIDGIEYNPNGSIDIIHTEEGIARNSAGNYSYEYNLSDHLGNVRSTFYKNPITSQLEVLQRDNYYAFGLRKEPVVKAGTNKYLYNGKELQEELGQYDYGARFYDPVIGRWNGIDAKAEKFHQFSPYSYAINNPLSYIDTDGRDIIIAFTGGPTGGGKTVDAKTGDAGTTGKVIRDAQKFADDHGIELQSRVITPGWTSGSSVKNALGFIKENYSKGEKVILYGYSYGGDFAVELSEALKEEGITVDLLVTVDASDGPLQNSSVNTIIPDNVKENQNFYQSNDSGRSSASQTSSGSSKKNKSADSGTTNSPGSNGGPNKSSDSKKTKVRNHYKKGSDLEHGNIDEKVNKDVKKYIEKVLGGS